MDIVLVGRDLIGNIINEVKMFPQGSTFEKEKGYLCDACEITLKNGQCIFLDPSFLCGISIGGIEKKEYYLSCKIRIE